MLTGREYPGNPTQQQPRREREPAQDIWQIDEKVGIGPLGASTGEEEDKRYDPGPHDRNPISPDHRRTPLQLSEHVGTVDMVSSDAVLQADSRDGLRERVGSRLKENKDG